MEVKEKWTSRADNLNWWEIVKMTDRGSEWKSDRERESSKTASVGTKWISSIFPAVLRARPSDRPENKDDSSRFTETHTCVYVYVYTEYIAWCF